MYINFEIFWVIAHSYGRLLQQSSPAKYRRSDDSPEYSYNLSTNTIELKVQENADTIYRWVKPWN